MGDVGDHFRAVNEARQEKRASNREQSARNLERRGIPFESKNGGAHLIVDGRVDFWPGTGRWTIRGGKTGFGLKRLLRELSDG